jgi:CheY-like chemotaxis protein
MMGQSRAVLIVEDDAELRSLMATPLEDGQLDIIECESAEAALATILIRRWSERAWTPVSSRARALRSMQASSKPMPAVIMARFQARLTGRHPQRQTRAVAEFLTALDDEGADADRKPPKVISPVDPCSAWTAKANKRAQFGYA